MKRENNRANHRIYNLEDHPAGSFISMESNLWFPHRDFEETPREKEREGGREGILKKHHERGRGEERGKVRREDKPSVFTRVINIRQVSWPPRRSISHAWHPATAPGNRARQIHFRVPTKQYPGNLQARSSPGNFSQGCIQTDQHALQVLAQKIDAACVLGCDASNKEFFKLDPL